MNIKLFVITILCSYALTTWAKKWSVAEEPTIFVKFLQYDSNQISQIEEVEGVKRKAIYKGEDQIEPEMSYLTHNILESDNFRIYHHSSYTFEGVKQKYASHQLNKVDIDDFVLSLGYGMEYKVKRDEWVGYEYLSTFPQDQGQSVRVFWRKFF